MFSIRKLPLAWQTLIGITLVSLVITISLALFLGARSKAFALAESEKQLDTQVVLLSDFLNFAKESMASQAKNSLDEFSRSLPSHRMTGNTLTVANGKNIPELVFGNIPGIANQTYLRKYQEANPSVSPAFLVASGGKMLRASTLLKSADGKYRDGEVITDDYVQTLLAGQGYTGIINRSGNLYVLGAMPLKDEKGAVIGGLTVRVDANFYLNHLRDLTNKLVIGQSGYVFLISEGIGDSKEDFFIAHPKLQGKTINSLEDGLKTEIQSIMARKNGFISYPWKDAQGRLETKVAAFRDHPDFHWVIVSSAPARELTGAFSTLQTWQNLGYAALIAALICSIGVLVRRQLSPLTRAQNAIAEIADNLDLTRRLNDASGDEIGRIARALDHMIERLQTAFCGVQKQMEEVNGLTESVADAARQVAQGSSEQRESAAAMAASIEEMTESIQTVSAGAADAQDMAEKAGALSEEGNTIIQKTGEEMTSIARAVDAAAQVIQSLGEESRHITEVVKVIKEVADQTNLLALNAAIEAARAGEQGKGFAVVADEVRQLAERTANSTGDIGSMIGKIQTAANNAVKEMTRVEKQVESGQSLAQEAGERMASIRAEAMRVSEAVASISSALKEQSHTSAEISKRVESISHMTGQNHAASESAAASVRQLLTATEKVGETLRCFRV
ncbi:MAG: methyl-accepting chemotaxis protein [Zoogloeaceae bacterium]|jgi:methyl-accepting chemotaxis protein|nr:methyl-accepting chemotaxis protein [Zoogloeaceae bacterium]